MPKLKPPGVYARYTEMFDVVDRQARAERVFGNLGAPAGPVHGRLGYLLFSDINSDRILKWSPEAKPKDPKKKASTKQDKPQTPDDDKEPPEQDRGTLETFREKSHGARGLTFDHQGRLLTCESTTGRVTRTEKNGAITVLADRSAGTRLAGPFDLVYSIDGSVYFTDVNVDSTRDKNTSAVYQISRTQIPGASHLKQVSRECERPAGIALSPRQDVLYVSDAARKNIRMHSINRDGTLASGRVFAEFTTTEAGDPGGLKTDEKGNVYATGPGGIWVFSPVGRTLGIIVLPELPNNLCWGAGFSSLYITAGATLYHLATRVAGTRTF